MEYVKITISDVEIADDIVVNLAELKAITGRTQQELIKDGIVMLYEYWKNISKGSDMNVSASN